ncbi:beta-1,4-galactosyltransferase galt-1-like [Paramacrobiotus metropolitanus]|uniref:beta-1,4-galactosyltransferase galt-1-like n=1 Tax=Paramacrobiotus metropolitanus TaxID=2943436 RepID=UPI0024463D15|nr:beta-1,4-galactosyltransferase galt-1-like [Paramacrobiotus metropolitanus]
MRMLHAAHQIYRRLELLALKRGIGRTHIQATLFLIAVTGFIALSTYLTILYYDSFPRIQRFRSSGWKECAVSSVLPEPKNSLPDPRWQRILEKVWVYSAFVTDKHPPQLTVEVIAIVELAENRFLDDAECQCVFGGDKGAVKAEMRVHNEARRDRHGTQYGDVRFICDIPPDVNTASVGVQCRSRSACDTVALPVHPLPDEWPRKLSMAVCGPVLYGNVSVNRLIEFIEYYQLIGIEKFIFYVDNPHSDLQKTLDYYHALGKVDFLNWKIPGINLTDYEEIWYYGQTAAYNDCAERTGYLWDYTLEVDLDEFVAITDRRPLSAVVRNGLDDCVIIRSTNMKLPPATASSKRLSPYSPADLLLRSSTHQSYIYPWYDRTKGLCRNRKVLNAGIHFPHFLTAGHSMRYADPDEEAVILHMREELLFEGTWPWVRWVVDERGSVYAERVAAHVERVVQALG